MNLRHYLGSLRRRALCALYRRSVPLGNGGPIVSFTFDDFPRTAFLVGGSILERFGVRGTYYVTGGLMNLSNELGDLYDQQDLHSLLEKGHELGSQTFNHSSCRAVPLMAFRDDVYKGISAVDRVKSHNPRNFAYPYGHVTFRGKKILGPELASSRSVVPGLNGPYVDLNLLQANRLYGDIDQSKHAEGLIQENVKRKSWLIFYTHDVRPKPSEYGCTPELLEFAVSNAAKSGSRILTVGQAVAELGVQAGSREALEYV